MRVTVTGATGLIGSRLVARLLDRGDEVCVLSRQPDRARSVLGTEVEAQSWDPLRQPAPTGALEGRDGVIHLAGEPVAQRWTVSAKRAIRDSRVTGTANLVAGLRALGRRPAVLIGGSAVGYYGSRGPQRLTEAAGPGSGFLAEVCVAWEGEAAAAAADLDMRVVYLRTGVVLDRAGGALAKMLPPFRAGVGGPVAGGHQFMPWILADDVVAMALAALDGERWRGPVNVCAPEAVTNAVFSQALGRALHRPALLPVPGLALRLLYGEMAEVVTEGQRAVPARATDLGFEFRHPRLDAALRDVLEG